MRIAHAPSQVERQPRVAVVGTFDGVHRGHGAVLDAAARTGLALTAVTFDPHPRVALGNRVELITTLERRLELLAAAGVETTLVLSFTTELQQLSPDAFVEGYLRSIGAEAVAAGPDFRFGARRGGDLGLVARRGLRVVDVTPVPGVSSTEIRRALGAGEVTHAAELLGRPYELDGVVVYGDQRGGKLGYPTANIALDASLACPADGVYAGWAHDHRAAVSIGTNPHYGGTERRVEPFLLDFDGDLYGERLVVEVWQRLRDQEVFGSEEALVAQIARDVDATRAAQRPV
jgi:riboflavin kinase/FMN adenylyltransferase